MGKNGEDLAACPVVGGRPSGLRLREEQWQERLGNGSTRVPARAGQML